MGLFMGGMGSGRRGHSSADGPALAVTRGPFQDGRLPLRMSALADGHETQIMEATAVERKSLDDPLFVQSGGLRKMSMPGG